MQSLNLKVLSSGLDIYEGEERGTNGVHAAAKSASVEGGSDLSPILSVANAAQFLFRLEGVLVLHRELSGHQIYIHAFTPPMAKVPVSKAEDQKTMVIRSARFVEVELFLGKLCVNEMASKKGPIIDFKGA